MHQTSWKLSKKFEQNVLFSADLSQVVINYKIEWSIVLCHHVLKYHKTLHYHAHLLKMSKRSRNCNYMKLQLQYLESAFNIHPTTPVFLTKALSFVHRILNGQKERKSLIKILYAIQYDLFPTKSSETHSIGHKQVTVMIMLWIGEVQKTVFLLSQPAKQN